MNAEQIRARFIEDNAEFLLSELNGVLRGEADFSSKSNVWLGFAFERLSKMVDDAGDLKKLAAQSGDKILEMLESGTISKAEARDLIDILKIKSEISESAKNALETFNVEIAVRQKVE